MGFATDPFSLLGLPRLFDISLEAIHSAHLTRVASTHPDLAPHSQTPDEDADPVAALNHAKRILENPELRANALLALLGGPTKESDRSLPPGFLMDIMETREAIEAAVHSKDPTALRHWRDWADTQRSEHKGAVSVLFRSLPQHPSAANLGSIRTRLNAWRYIERLIEQLDPDYEGLRGSTSSL